VEEGLRNHLRAILQSAGMTAGYLRLFELASVLVCVDHVARIIVNADHGIA
jgi:hypothetical protein